MGQVSGELLRNRVCNWRIYADFAHSLIRTARKLHANDNLSLDLNDTFYALDTTAINIYLSIFPRAKFSQAKRAIKLHIE